MKKIELLRDYEKISDIHALRLSAAIAKTERLFPLREEVLKGLVDEDVALLDMMTTRFGKLQDLLGTKIFPLILDILGEGGLSFIDKLNSLEKLHIIDDTRWWRDIRDLRNKITHDYPDDYVLLASSFNALLLVAKQLVKEWTKLKLVIDKLPTDK